MAKWIDTAGGPFVLVPMSLVERWSGINPTFTTDADEKIPDYLADFAGTDYARACSTEGAFALKLDGAECLVFNDEECSATWLPGETDKEAGILLCYYFANSEEEVLADFPHLQRTWTAECHFNCIDNVCLLFDSGVPGKDIAFEVDNTISVSLAPGRYRVEGLSYADKDRYGLFAHRLMID